MTADGEWVLIMTLSLANAPPVIETIAGFTSEEQCEAAGKKWRDEFNREVLGHRSEPASTVCVYRGPSRS